MPPVIYTRHAEGCGQYWSHIHGRYMVTTLCETHYRLRRAGVTDYQNRVQYLRELRTQPIQSLPKRTT